MALLVELLPSVAVSWSDADGSVLWQGYGDLYHRNVDDSDTIYLSLDGEEFDHFWKPWIISFSAPSYETEYRYGGFVKMQFGSITFSPDVFRNSWPPPKYAAINVFHTETTEDAAMKIFEGNIYLDSYDEESISYQLYAPTYSKNLLETALDYNGDEVELPIAFGNVTHVEPVRLPDDGFTRQTYHLGGIGTSSDAKTIISYESYSGGSETKVMTSAAHGWSNGQDITIMGSVNFDGTHEISDASGSTFVIPVNFPTDNSERLPIRASAFIFGSFQVYEDGVSIDTNVIVNGDGTFSLNERADGVITISGTGAHTSLSSIISWATGEIGINTFNDDYARSPSPSVGYWANHQMPMIDFISELAAFFSHYFYVKSDILYLCDMFADNGADTFLEHEYFTCSYSAPDAVKQITANWITWVAANGVTDDGENDYKYIREVENEAVVTGSYDWGSDMEIEPFHDSRSSIVTALNNILILLNKDQASITIPIETTLPDPGKKLTFHDSIMVVDTETYIWARSLQFDFENNEVKISGEGVIS